MDEQYSEIGRMYVERENVEREIACIANKLSRIASELRQAVDVIEKRHDKPQIAGKDTSIHANLSTAMDISKLMEKEFNLLDKLAKLEEFFAARRK